jgi:hypothetical protein
MQNDDKQPSNAPRADSAAVEPDDLVHLTAMMKRPDKTTNNDKTFSGEPALNEMLSALFDGTGAPGHRELHFKSPPKTLYGTGDDLTRLDPQKVRDIWIPCTYSI